MRILVVNDDGIQAPGIRKLAELARQFGEVTVAAPKSQCSGMSHRITVNLGMRLRKWIFRWKEWKLTVSMARRRIV